MNAWLWPDHRIGKRESRRLREEHNKLVNAYAEVRSALARARNFLVNVPTDDQLDAKLPTSGETGRQICAAVRAVLGEDLDHGMKCPACKGTTIKVYETALVAITYDASDPDDIRVIESDDDYGDTEADDLSRAVCESEGCDWEGTYAETMHDYTPTDTPGA